MWTVVNSELYIHKAGMLEISLMTLVLMNRLMISKWLS